MRSLAVTCSVLFAGAVAQSSEAFDGEALVQHSLSLEASAEQQSQVATFSMLSEAMGMRLLGKLRSHPHHHKASSGHPTVASVAKKSLPTHQVAAGCTEADFKAVEQHMQELAANYTPRVQEAIKGNDTAAVANLIQEVMPTECNAKDIITVVGIKWEKLEKCIVLATRVSPACVQCPVQFLQKVAGKSVLEVPFSCAAKCAPMAAVGLKCGGAVSECDDSAVLDKSAACMRCMSPKLTELGQCAGLPHAPRIEEKLNALLVAVGKGKEEVDGLLKQEAEAGREELQPLVKEGTTLTKVLGLMFSAVMD